MREGTVPPSPQGRFAPRVSATVTKSDPFDNHPDLGERAGHL
jgi:hypothetical protein